MTDEDDWFEQALTEEDEPDDERTADDEPADEGSVSSETGDEETSDDASTESTEGRAPDAAGNTADDDELFEDDFASAFEGVGQGGPGDGGAEGAAGGGDGEPFVGGDGEPFAGGDDGPFAGGDNPFGGGGGDGGGAGPFAGGGGSGGGDFGMGDFGMGSGGDTDFSDEAVDSEIDRIDLGIQGLDEMIRGGVPDSSLMAVIGSAGTGKTTFGLQFLEQGLADGEQAIYITLEESRERVIRSAEEKGWPYEEYVAEGRLAVVDMDPIEMANSLSSIRSELPRLVERFEASRLVLDSVSLLEMMYDERSTRRNEIYTFARSLKESGVTIMLTSEADVDNPYASRHGIVEYLTDAVYILQYVRPSDFRETRLAVEIQKIRDAHHSREMKPYEITDEGISVYRQANIF